ncbi:YciI family protein [Sinorhizobium meliloti]|uniref:YciI family protein n=1 Tax=Rhizobium meliloti TaxID=382 RepID=UPI003F14B60C
MPYFVVQAFDKPGMGEVRQRTRPAHRERLRMHDHPLKVRIAGPLLNEAGEMVGTHLIVEAETSGSVRDFVDADPYSLAGLYESVQVTAFQWGLGVPEEGSNG